MSLLLFALASLTPAEQAFFGDAYFRPTYAVEQITGRFTLPVGWGSAAGCTGTLTIRPDATAELRSGAAVVTMAIRFEIDEESLDWMHRQVTATNGKADCNGKVWAAGATDGWAFDPLIDGGMRFCTVEKVAPRQFVTQCPHILTRSTAS